MTPTVCINCGAPLKMIRMRRSGQVVAHELAPLQYTDEDGWDRLGYLPHDEAMCRLWREKKARESK